MTHKQRRKQVYKTLREHIRGNIASLNLNNLHKWALCNATCENCHYNAIKDHWCHIDGLLKDAARRKIIEDLSNKHPEYFI